MLKNKVSDADLAVGRFIAGSDRVDNVADRIRTRAALITQMQVSQVPVETPGGAVFRPPVRIGNRGAGVSETAVQGLQRDQSMDQYSMRRGLENMGDRMITQELQERAAAVRAIAVQFGDATEEQRKYLNWEKALRDATLLAGLAPD